VNYKNELYKKFLLNFLILTTLGLSLISRGNTVYSSVANEYQIKSVFLYSLTKGFITWPPTAFANKEEPFRLCILGEDPFGDTIDLTTEGQRGKDGRSLVINRLSNSNALSSCHLLFIANSQSLPLTRELEIAKRHSILTVSDIKDFATTGGSIEFFTLEDKVKIAINICVLEKAHLKAASDLLKVSKVIRNCPN
jgi:hypothetical protein